ncbi:hypothetical protein ACI3PL_23705, partial [Lacticaseibacillus paracasei]
MTDLKIDRTLGTGSFGRVLLVSSTDKDMSEFMACKAISKERVIKTRQVCARVLVSASLFFCRANAQPACAHCLHHPCCFFLEMCN